MSEDDNEIERMLLQFRPADPPESLRPRVLSPFQSQSRARPVRWVWGFRAAAAAMLTFAFGLNIAAGTITANATRSVGVGPAVWTDQAEEAARMLNGSEWARRYIALGLMSRPSLDRFPPQPPTIPGELP